MRCFLLTPLFSAVILATTAVPNNGVDALEHDTWEFHGGARKRIKHGLNAAVRESVESQIVVTGDGGGSDEKDGGSSSSNKYLKMKKHDDFPILPDRFSVLNFERSAEDFAADGDTEEEKRQANATFWGRLYVDGFPTPMQYFRAHFGAPPRDGDLNFLLAEPVTMCDNEATPVLYNRDSVDGNTVIVATRGECSFGEKAVVAGASGAAALLFINDVDGNDHPSGPEAQDVDLSATMIGKHDGDRLLEALNATSFFDETERLSGRFVPVSCLEGKSKTLPSLKSYCSPVTRSDREFVSSLAFGGNIVVNDDGEKSKAFEFIQAEFGGKIDRDGQWGLAGSSSEQYCNITAADAGSGLQGMAVLVGRGGCDFATKAETLSEAGARVMLLANHNETIQRMGVDTEHRGRRIPLSAMMVSDSTGSYLSRMVKETTSPNGIYISLAMPVDHPNIPRTSEP